MSFLLAAGIVLTCSSLVWAQVAVPIPPPPPPGPPPAVPSQLDAQHKNPIKKVAPGIFRLGDIEINKKNKSLSFPVAVNMDKGLLEYLLVRTGGKTHESLFRTEVQPYDLQFAFLLLGFEGTDAPLSFQGDPAKPKGEAVTITVSYTKADGKSVMTHPEDFMVKFIDNKPAPIKKLDWVFTGSAVHNGQFMAQMDGSIVAIYHDPYALLDNASAGGETDKVWFVREGAVPPIGTAMVLTIKSNSSK